MKRQLIAMFAAAASFATVANAEIVLTDDLSVSGYLDLWAGNDDAAGDKSYTTVAEFELAFSYTTEPAFAVVELSFEGTGVGKNQTNSKVELETAIVGYNFSESLSVSAGNILSYLGWETYDATGLYQYSYAYRGQEPLYPSYAVGASIDYVTDEYSLGLWVGDSDEAGQMSVEAMVKYTGIEGVTLFAAYADDPLYETINFWASYETGAFTFAAEYIDVDNTTGLDSEGYLFMMNYAFENNAGLTLRYSVQEDEGVGAGEDWEQITISPSYTFSDNLAGLLELSIVDGDDDADYYWGAELLYTF
jgi:hypothetical protein